MNYLAVVIAVIYSIGLLWLCWSYWQTVRLVQQQPSFDATRRPVSPLPRLDVVIPVKDEEQHIAACVESVLEQDYPDLRVVVVNDRSADGTASMLQAIQDRDPRVNRLDIAELPAGLFGKPHAVHCAAAKLRGDVVVFLDSDFQLRPHCLSAIVGHLLDDRLDWLAVMGAPELTQFWERLLVPLFGALAYAWYDPRSISDQNSPDAIGSGFMCVRRSAYDAIGGHGAVVRAYDEDSALVRLAKQAGQRVAYVLTPDLFTLRFYGGLKKTIHGMTRTCIGGIKTLPRMFITLGALNFVSLLPIEILGGLAIARSFGVRIPWAPLWVCMALAHLFIAGALCWLIYDRARTSRWLSLAHPLGAVMMIGVCLRATRGLIRRGPITWRGTTY